MLLGAATIWGMAFIPQKMTVVAAPPFTATAVRFLLAGPLALVVALAVRASSPKIRRVPWSSGVLLGAMLFFAYVLQTAALVTAPVARVSLITGMYAVFVPLFAPLLGHPRPTRAHWAGALAALVGLMGLVGILGDSSALSVPLNIGDVFVLGHALISAFQVLLVARLAPGSDTFTLNAVQLMTVMVLAIPAALLVDGPSHLLAMRTFGTATWQAFGYLAALSTVLAFILQLRGQRHTSAPSAAVLMLMETPIAVLAAVVLLDEQMNAVQWLGASVLVAGIFISLWPEVSGASRAGDRKPPGASPAPPPRS